MGEVVQFVVGVSFDTDTKKEYVVYRALYGNGQLWHREINEFLSKVPVGKNNPTGQKYRFEVYEPKSISEYSIGD